MPNSDNKNNNSLSYRLTSKFNGWKRKKPVKFGVRKHNAIKYIAAELALAVALIGIVLFASGLIGTATQSQEDELVRHDQSWRPTSPSTEIPTKPPTELPTDHVIDPTFEVIVTEPQETITQIVKYPTDQMCFIGDSRTVGMRDAIFTDVLFVAKSSIGLDWLKKTAIPEFDEMSNEISLCVVALGINDVYNLDAYIDALNAFADKYPNKVFVYANIGPIDETKYDQLTNEQIREFNDAMAAGLSDRWQVLDQYAYLMAEGFETTDGLHYKPHDSTKVFAWMIDAIQEQTITVIG